MVKSVNETLSKLVKKYPERFSTFAAIAIRNLDAATKELEMAVAQLNLKRTMIVPQAFFDYEKYWPVFGMAEKLDVQVYIHSEIPSPDM